MRFVFLILFFLSQFSLSEIINKIDISGLNNISRGTVLNYLPVETGDEFTKEMSNEVQNSLIRTGMFKKVEINFINQTLSLNLIESPTIKYFEIKDYKEDEVLSAEIVENIIANYDLKPGSIFNEQNLLKIKNQLTQLYISNAFYSMKLKEIFDFDENNRVGIDFIIDEGEQALINTMKINANKAFTSDELLELFEIGEADFFLINWFTERDKFSKTKFEAGIESIRSKYFEDGFLNFKFDDVKVIFNKELNQLNIELTINEGERFKIEDYVFTGDTISHSPEELKKYFTLSSGDFFKRSYIVNGVKKIASLLQNDGYAYANISSDVKISDSSRNLIVTVNIDTDSRVYVNRINITGNNRTQDDVIRREINILEGQRYSKESVDESIKRIKRLGYFSSVDYKMKRYSDEKDKVDIDIFVEETKTGEFSIGLSHSNSTGAALNMSIKQKNFFGTGNTLNAAFSNSTAVKETSFYFKDPHFNNDGHSLSYGVFSKSINAEDLDASAYTTDETGFTSGYGIPVSEYGDIFSEFRLSSLDLTCGTLMSSYEPVTCSNNNNMIDSKLSFSYSSNSLNDFFSPTQGVKDNIKFNIGLPIGDYKYYQIEGLKKNYSSLSDRYVLKVSNRLNYVNSYGGDTLPFFKRYYEGGSSSIRGFNFNSLGAKYDNGKPKGGELSFISSLGISSPMDFIGVDNKNIKAFAFLDAGGIAEKISTFDSSDIRASTGIGIDWLTPVGPLGIHFAKPLIKKSGDQTKSFSFDLGTSF